MGKSRSHRGPKKMAVKSLGKPWRKEVDGDLVTGLGRAHQEDFLSLDNRSDDESGEENENPVFDLTGSGDDDEDDLDEEQLTGLEAKLVKQSRLMKQKAQFEEDDNEDEDEERERAAWGKSKKLYYSADNVDFELQSDDEEAPAEEEVEVLRLQRKAAASLQVEDYEQDDEGCDGREETLQEAAKRKEQRFLILAEKDTEAIAIEEVEKDIHALSKAEKMDVVMSDAPELVGLLTELREGLDELQNKMQPLVEKVKDGQYATKEGISYLEVKHLLLLNYCQSIIFYLLLKAEGGSVRDHPVIGRLVELRLFLEKIRPIDKKLQYQIDKLLKTASAPPEKGQEDKEDALKYKPNPDLLVSKMDEEAQVGGVYRPPMITPVAMDEDVRPRNQRQKNLAEKESRRKASQSAFMKEIANELEGKPEEIQEAVGTESREMMREKARLDIRAKDEEDLFARVPLSRVERKKLKQLKQSKSGWMDLLDDFDDGLADLVGTHADQVGLSRGGGPPDDILKPIKLSQIIAESGRPAKKPKVSSGDTDLPAREDLGERRRKREMQNAQHFYEGHSDEYKFEPEEDDFYKEAKQLADAKKAAKRTKYDKELVLPFVQGDEEGKRRITNMMEKNRGLTPHRKKVTKNPRKKYKLKHGNAVIRRTGQVSSVKAGSGSYGGERTGIRTNLSRSVRIQN